MKFLWIHRFTTINTRCKPCNPLRFWNFFRVSNFWTEPFELLRIYVDSDSLTFLSMKEVSFNVHLCFIRRFGLELSGFFGFDSVLLILVWNPKINRWFFFFFFTGSKPLKFFLSSSQFRPSVIVLSPSLSVMDSVLELQRIGSRMKIRHWISESCHGFHGFGAEFAYENG